MLYTEIRKREINHPEEVKSMLSIIGWGIVAVGAIYGATSLFA